MELTNIFGQMSLTKMGVLGLEIFMLFMSVVYFIYAVILSRRVRIMNQNLKTSYDKSFVRLSKIHILASVVAVTMFALSLFY
jgi:hypothetical protein